MAEDLAIEMVSLKKPSEVDGGRCLDLAISKEEETKIEIVFGKNYKVKTKDLKALEKKHNLPTYGVVTILLYYLHERVKYNYPSMWAWMMTTAYAIFVSSLIIESSIRSNYHKFEFYLIGAFVFTIPTILHEIYQFIVIIF